MSLSSRPLRIYLKFGARLSEYFALTKTRNGLGQLNITKSASFRSLFVTPDPKYQSTDPKYQATDPKYQAHKSCLSRTPDTTPCHVYFPRTLFIKKLPTHVLLPLN